MTRNPIHYLRRWRQRRAHNRSVDELRGYRTPVQVCPRGCEYRELARRDLLTRTRISGRAVVRAAFTFETTNCPECGARLVRECARCDHEVFAPVADRCQFCGLPHPWASERRGGPERAGIRLWDPDPAPDDQGDSVKQANDPALCLYDAGGRGDLWVIDGDVTQLAVDAVISNDDVDGRMWAQTASSIKRAAGEGVERLAQEGRPFKLGQAWVTSSGALRQMKGIVHVASLSRHGDSHLKIVRECLVAALEVAREQRYRSIGLAAIGSGPNAIDPQTWFRAFAETAIAHFDGADEPTEDGPPPLAVVLALFEPSDFEAEVEALRRTVNDVWCKLGRPASGEPVWRPPTSLWRETTRRLLPARASV